MVEIPEDIGHCLPSLLELDLSGNDFHTLPASIKHLSSLVELYLCNCKYLRSLPEVSSSVKVLYANGCVALEHASQALPHSVGTLTLSGCIRLGQEEARSLAERWASIAGSTKQALNVWLPWSEVPRWFVDRAEGPSLTIHLPRSHFLRDVYGIATCVVVAAERHYDTNKLLIAIDCDFRDNCGRSVSRVQRWRRPYLFVHDELFVQSEYMHLGIEFLSGHDHHLEEVFQDIHLSFSLLTMGGCACYVKVKECGVRLLFQGDIDDEFDENGSMDETSDDKELESLNKNEEFSMPSSLSLTRGESSGSPRVPIEEAEDPPNNNRPYGFGDNERQDAHQLNPWRANFFRFFCCICDVLRVFSDLFPH